MKKQEMIDDIAKHITTYLDRSKLTGDKRDAEIISIVTAMMKTNTDSKKTIRIQPKKLKGQKS